MLRVFGENLRRILAASFGNRVRSVIAGLGVTSMVQSSTATCLIVASFVGKNLVTTSAALAVMLGADVGTSLMAVVFSFDLSWLSPSSSSSAWSSSFRAKTAAPARSAGS